MSRVRGTGLKTEGSAMKGDARACARVRVYVRLVPFYTATVDPRRFLVDH